MVYLPGEDKHKQPHSQVCCALEVVNAPKHNTSLPQMKFSTACLSATVSAALPQMILMRQGWDYTIRPINAKVAAAGYMLQSTNE